MRKNTFDETNFSCVDNKIVQFVIWLTTNGYEELYLLKMILQDCAFRLR